MRDEGHFTFREETQLENGSLRQDLSTALVDNELGGSFRRPRRVWRCQILLPRDRENFICRRGELLSLNDTSERKGKIEDEMLDVAGADDVVAKICIESDSPLSIWTEEKHIRPAFAPLPDRRWAGTPAQ